MRSRWFKSYGNSMLPILHDKDIVEIIPISYKNITVDEIVFYPFKHGYITHRVIYANPQRNWLLTKGDNNLFPDKRIKKKKILGRVNLVHRKGDSIEINDYYLFQSTYYFEEIKLFKKKLEENKIDYVFLKGLPVHIYYKKSFPKRDFADCDLLFKREDQEKIHLMLVGLGYQRQPSTKSPLHTLSKDDVHSLEYYKIRGMFKVIFDIHFKVALLETKLGSTNRLYSSSLSNRFAKELLEKSITVTVLGEKYKLLDHQHLIVYLATHIFHHNFKGYHRYIFLSEVIKKETPDLLKIFKIANDYKLENYLYPVFVLYNKHYTPKLDLKKFKKTLKPKIIKLSNAMTRNTNIFADEDLFSSAFNRLYYMYFFSEANMIIKNWIFLILAFKSIIFLRPIVWIKIIKFSIKKFLFFSNNLFRQKSVKKMVNIF